MLPLLGRVVLVAAAGALAVAACGGGDAFWLSVPLALLVAGPADSRRAGFFVAGLVVLAACVPAVLDPQLGPLPGAPLVLAVAGGSVAVLGAVRSRLEGERSAMRRWALTDPLTGGANPPALGLDGSADRGREPARAGRANRVRGAAPRAPEAPFRDRDDRPRRLQGRE